MLISSRFQALPVVNGAKICQKMLGPPSIPFFGSLPFVIHLFGKHNYEMCREVAKKYGPVFGVQIGMFYHGKTIQVMSLETFCTT